MQINDFNWKIGGQAGFGIMSSGMMFAKVCTRSGLFIHDYSEYPSLIRGGHNTYQVYVSAKNARSQRRIVNLLVALNTKTITEYLSELIAGSGIICDLTRVQVDEKKIKKAKILLYDVPLNEIAKQVGGDEVMRNTVALGATLALVKYPFENLANIIIDQFSHKDKSVAEQNIKAARAGYEYMRTHYQITEFGFALKAKVSQPQMVITANDAIALGALAAGCKFYVAYPMTPASSILHTLAELGPECGMVVRHAEDEISVINMAHGAASTGVRTMLGTSGGGWALMNEGYSMGGITETPFIVIMSMRPGPATGLPTWTEQGDLKFIINSGHGEFPRVVLTPGDQTEAFVHTTLAFNLADIIQNPVVVLVDKYLSESHISCPLFDTKKVVINRGKLLNNTEVKKLGDLYKRYQITRDGISPRAVFGQDTYIYINSDEHDETGFSEESAENRINQAKKRAKKLRAIKKLLPKAKLYGPKNASLTLVGWGSIKGPLLDALQSDKLKKKVNFVHFPIVSPLPENTFTILKNAKKIVLIENNFQGQFAEILRAETGLKVTDKILRYDGRPFYEDELVGKINNLR